MALLTKPVAPRKTVMTSSIDPNDANKTIDTPVTQIDKDSEDFYEYQHELKSTSRVRRNTTITCKNALRSSSDNVARTSSNCSHQKKHMNP